VLTETTILNGSLTGNLAAMNIRRGAALNPYAKDMEMGPARLTITGMVIDKLVIDEVWRCNKQGKYSIAAEETVFEDDEALAQFITQTSGQMRFYTLSEAGENAVVLAACGTEPFFTVHMHYDTLTVEWDELTQPSWWAVDEPDNAP
ncbi:MAG: hypothetical protein IIX06_00520, partial [Bacteroidales bacterium]|nr:hypothetical protein [Bacteroidales bacterium]